jgi:hypothetical protein
MRKNHSEITKNFKIFMFIIRDFYYFLYYIYN